MSLPAEFHSLAAKVRNWGRWGDDDEIGTLNLIDAAAVRRGVGSVVDGRVFRLGLPLSLDGPQLGFVPGRVNPLRTMIALNDPIFGDPEGIASSDDVVVMGLQAATHWDSLAHVSYGGHIYNGFPTSTTTTWGAERCGIDKVPHVVSRGVLLDVARALGIERLEGGHAIADSELDAACAMGGVTVEPGDVVLVRTGQMQLLHRRKKVEYASPSPGLSMQTVPWLHAHDVAAVATDTLPCEVFPGERDDLLLPVHMLHLVDMGLTQGQNFDLEALAADCASDGRYTFLLDATPLPFVGGLGTPLDPVAVK